MANIRLTKEQESMLAEGETIEVSTEDLDFDVILNKRQSEQIEVDVVETLETHNHSSTSKGSPQLTASEAQSEIKRLKKRVVDLKTRKKKLEKEHEEVTEKIDYFNEKMRLAKEQDRDDLVEKITDRKQDKMDELNEINSELSDLKQQEHNIRTQIDDLEQRV